MPTLAAIILLELSLGMRHAADPDHVVAITTIVCRERTIFHAALIGPLWELGHTITILAVGSAIILLKLTIPPALGLTTELSVAFMLILLGVLNLTGPMRRAIKWLSIRGYSLGAHAHVIFGRKMIHTHDADPDASLKRRLLGINAGPGRRVDAESQGFNTFGEQEEQIRAPSGGRVPLALSAHSAGPKPSGRATLQCIRRLPAHSRRRKCGAFVSSPRPSLWPFPSSYQMHRPQSQAL